MEDISTNWLYQCHTKVNPSKLPAIIDINFDTPPKWVRGFPFDDPCFLMMKTPGFSWSDTHFFVMKWQFAVAIFKKTTADYDVVNLDKLIGSFPKVGLKIKNIWNHQPVMIYPWFLMIINKTPRQHSQGTTQLTLNQNVTFCRINCSLFRKSS